MNMGWHVCLFLLLFCFSAQTKSTRFEVKDAAFRNSIQWTSDAALEKILGTSHFISGWMEVDPQNLKGQVKGEFEVDMRSFEMGTESRQVKLRETLLNVQEFPTATFKAEKLENVSGNELTSGKAVSGSLVGMLSFRGVSRKEALNIRATYFPQTEWTKRRLGGNLLKLVAKFEVTLSSYKYVLPELFSGLLAPTLKVEADVLGTDQLPVMAQ